MTRTRPILAAVLTASLFTASARAAGEFTITWHQAPTAYGYNRGPSSASAGLRRQISQAERDLAKAYAATAKNDTAGAELRAAQDAVVKTRQDYQKLLNAARKALDDDPQIAPHRKVVRDLEAKIAEEPDLKTRAELSSDLMAARGKMTAAEWEILGLDPDLAIARSAVTDAVNALKAVQISSVNQRQQDPAVVAARQRLHDLRRQLSRR